MSRFCTGEVKDIFFYPSNFNDYREEAMTAEEKKRVLELRNSGKGAKAISKATGLSENTVKSFLRRYSFSDAPVVLVPIKYDKKDEPRCKQCGKIVTRYEGRRARLFCGDACRNRWWKEHPEEVNRKAIYAYECAYCHKAFTAYGNSTRKYCSHECYVNDRYGGGR